MSITKNTNNELLVTLLLVVTMVGAQEVEGAVEAQALQLPDEFSPHFRELLVRAFVSPKFKYSWLCLGFFGAGQCFVSPKFKYSFRLYV